MTKILLVEDGAMIASGLLYALEQEGYAATHCKDVKAASRAIQTAPFDLAILDMSYQMALALTLVKSLGIPVPP